MFKGSNSILRENKNILKVFKTRRALVFRIFWYVLEWEVSKMLIANSSIVSGLLKFFFSPKNFLTTAYIVWMETAKRNTSTPFSKPRKEGSPTMHTSFTSKDSRGKGDIKSPTKAYYEESIKERGLRLLSWTHKNLTCDNSTNPEKTRTFSPEQ